MNCLRFALVAALSLSLAGCILNSSGVRVEDSRLVEANAPFSTHLRKLGQTCRTESDGFLHVQVELQNDDACDFEFLYRFQWLDGDGVLVPESAPVWRRAFAHGRDKFFLKGVSERRDAKDFRLVVRPK